MNEEYLQEENYQQMSKTEREPWPQSKSNTVIKNEQKPFGALNKKQKKRSLSREKNSKKDKDFKDPKEYLY